MKYMAILVSFLLIQTIEYGKEEKLIYDKNDAAHFKYYENDENIAYWYEWWYGNIKDGENGLMITFITLGDLNNPLLSVVGAGAFFFKKDGVVSSFISFPFIPYTLDYEKCNVSILGNKFYEENGKFFVEYKGKEIEIKAEIKPAGKKFLNSCNIDEWQWMNWYVASPYGSGRAEIICNGEKYIVEGNAYHDHNWGIAKFYKLKWDWGEFNFGNIALIYGFVNGKDEIFGGVYIVKENEYIFIPYGKSNMQIIEWKKCGIEKKPKKILISANDENVELKMNIEMDKCYHIFWGLKGYLIGKAIGELKIYDEEITFFGVRGFYEHR